MTNGSYKYCPHKILDEGWDKFVALVQTKLDEIQGNKPIQTDTNEDIPTVKPTETNEEKIDVSLINKILNKLLEWLSRK